MISSTSNPRIVRARRLRKRAERETRGLLLAEGRRAVRAALDAGTLEELFTTNDDAQVEHATRRRVPRAQVTPAVMAHLSTSAGAPGVLGIARIPAPRAPGDGLVVLMLGVRDPSSAGGVLATIDAVGGAGMIVGPGCTDIFAPRVVRAAGGAHWRVPLDRRSEPAVDLVEAERARGRTIVALREVGGAPWETELRGSVCVVLGNERDDAEVLDKADAQVAVPTVTGGPGMALRAAVVLYEWVRQRGQ